MRSERSWVLVFLCILGCGSGETSGESGASEGASSVDNATPAAWLQFSSNGDSAAPWECSLGGAAGVGSSSRPQDDDPNAGLARTCLGKKGINLGRIAFMRRPSVGGAASLGGVS